MICRGRLDHSLAQPGRAPNVAAPVRWGAEVVAALSLPFLAGIDAERRRALRDAVIATAAAISAELGLSAGG